MTEDGLVSLLFSKSDPQYLSGSLKRNNDSVYNATTANHITLTIIRTRTAEFKNSFVPFLEWSKLNNLTKQSEYIKKIENLVMKDVKSNGKLWFSIRGPQSVKLLTQLRLNISHLKEQHLDITLETVQALYVSADYRE